MMSTACKSIIITVPHSGSSTQPDDPGALSAALEVNNAISAFTGTAKCMIPQMFVSRTPRSAVVDLNRSFSRNQDFRPSVRKELSRGTASILLDIHSYPPSASSLDFYTLTQENPAHAFAADLCKFVMINSDIQCRAFIGQDNDIIAEASSVGEIPGILVEFNEATEKTREIATLIALWLSRTL